MCSTRIGWRVGKSEVLHPIKTLKPNCATLRLAWYVRWRGVWYVRLRRVCTIAVGMYNCEGCVRVPWVYTLGRRNTRSRRGNPPSLLACGMVGADVRLRLHMWAWTPRLFAKPQCCLPGEIGGESSNQSLNLFSSYSPIALHSFNNAFSFERTSITTTSTKQCSPDLESGRHEL